MKDDQKPYEHLKNDLYEQITKSNHKHTYYPVLFQGEHTPFLSMPVPERSLWICECGAGKWVNHEG